MKATKTYTKAEVIAVARLCDTRSKFSNRYPGECYAARKNGWTVECVAHMHTPRTPDNRALKEYRKLNIHHHTVLKNGDRVGVMKPICPGCHNRAHQRNANIGGIKVGAGIKLFRLDIEDMDYLDRIGVLELMEAVSLGKESADPMKAYEGIVTAINNDGTATVELSNYDEDSHYEDGRGSVRDVDFDFLFVIS